MASQKCKIILLQAVLKDFWSANLKLKKLSLSKLSLPHTEKNARMGVVGSYFWLQVICGEIHKEFSEKA